MSKTLIATSPPRADEPVGTTDEEQKRVGS